MSGIKAEVKKVCTIFNQNLNIPEYQRPYRWEIKQVEQLLEDIYVSWKQQREAYRIGSIILYDKEKELDIVDGQQRITTIILILLQLSDNTAVHLSSSLKYSHTDSKKAIITNSTYIKYWISENTAHEKTALYKYINESCEFVEVKVSDHAEAFQMFDSQNSKGKELEAYNLLKAYHIRAMSEDSEEIKVHCDQRWENAVRHPLQHNEIKDILKQLFSEQLYRPRLWSRKEYAYRLNKDNLHEFKGLTFMSHQAVDYPFQNKDLLQNYVLKYIQTNGLPGIKVKDRFNTIKCGSVNPFVSINQNIINGRAFFEYVETYAEIYKQLFIYKDDKVLFEFRNFYKHCVDYPTNRKGDLYLKELYKSLILFFFDKYGEDGVLKYYKTLYVIVYRLRLEKQKVKYDHVMKYPVDNHLFTIIEKSKSYSDLKYLSSFMARSVDCRMEVPTVIKALRSFDIIITAKEKKIDLAKYED
jgi:uncharacterized protein (DUF305 family)